MQQLSRSRVKPLVIIGIVFLVLGALRIPNALLITETATNNAQVFGAFASTVVFLLLGLILLLKGLQLKKRESQAKDPGTNSGAG